MATRSSRKKPVKSATTVESHYVKSNYFRVVHVDGVYGGLTPTGQIHAALFSQRTAIPKLIEFNVSPDGQLAEEQRREGRAGIVRELEVDAVFTIDFAKALRKWLDEKIEQYNSITEKKGSK